MNIKEQLKMAVENRELKRAKANTEVRNYINDYLEENLPKAISEDRTMLVWRLGFSKVPRGVWDELDSYDKGLKEVSYKSIIKDYVDEVYKPYLVGDEVEVYVPDYIIFDENSETFKLRVVFYLNQD